MKDGAGSKQGKAMLVLVFLVGAAFSRVLLARAATSSASLSSSSGFLM